MLVSLVDSTRLLPMIGRIYLWTNKNRSSKEIHGLLKDQVQDEMRPKLWFIMETKNLF